MKNNYMFFANKECEFYPCHKLEPGEELNCLQCFCAFYFTECPEGATPIVIDVDGSHIKDCSNCTWIHNPNNYGKIMQTLSKKIYDL